MKLILNNEYTIRQEDLCYALDHTYVTYGTGSNKSEKPRLRTKTVGYYQKIEDAVEKFVWLVNKEKTKDFEGDLDGYVKRLNEISAYTIDEVLKGVRKCK